MSILKKTNLQISLDIINSDYFISNVSNIVVDEDFDCIISALKKRIINAEYLLKRLEGKL